MQPNEAIRFMRDSSGLTQRELSEKVGRSPSWAGVVEGSNRSPSLATVALAASACGFKLEIVDKRTGRAVGVVEPPCEEPHEG